MGLKLYNSLTKKLDEFKPLSEKQVTMYTCGPTVYDYVQIGNWRTYFLGDLLYRVLLLDGYKVKYIMNLTDVGHLTGDNALSADTGDDRLEKAAIKEGRSARDIATFYIEDFYKGYEKLGLKKPKKFTRATEYIKDQIELIRRLESKGFTYKISDGIYFDSSKYADYGKLSGLTADSIKEGARVEINPEKKHPNDFALWKFSPKDSMRWQEWDSPWGLGFPGWHIECSAMAIKELGESIDIHLGGEDLRMIHHQNEIAQSECATGKKFATYWLHGAFLTVDGGRMGKSMGNAYTLLDVEQRGYDAMSLRYFYMSAHYRTPLNFTWEALQGANSALKKMYDLISGYHVSDEAEIDADYFEKFKHALHDDLNMPKAFSVIWELLKSETVSEEVKVVTMLKFDEVLGLKLENFVGFEIPDKVVQLAKTRDAYRKACIWDKADAVRHEIEALGFVVEDVLPVGYKIKRKLL